MSIHFSEEVQLTQTTQYDTLDGYFSSAADFVVPRFPVPLLVCFDSTRRRFALEWRNATEQVDAAGGQLRIRAGQKDLGAIAVGRGPFPPTKEGAFFADDASTKHSIVQVELTLRLNSPGPLVPQVKEPAVVEFFSRASILPFPTKRTLIPFSAGIVRKPYPADVLFSFPRTGHRLWADEATLARASPYCAQLLSSAFAEGSTSTTPLKVSGATVDPYEFEESDDETDLLEARRDATTPSTPFKTITITDTAYSTYLAVLVYLYSHHISFAPLLSTFRTSGESRRDASPARSSALTSLTDTSSDALLPPPVSPKSVYRLAHLLDLADLSSLALANFASQLTPQNAAYELYSDVATCYPAVRDVVLDFVVERWSEVKDERATKEMEVKAEAGELSGAAGTAMKLARRLAAKASTA
ncbi:hypothetical protein JCM6882_009652 [Rhodosporidiobolus microsporus]